MNKVLILSASNSCCRLMSGLLVKHGYDCLQFAIFSYKPPNYSASAKDLYGQREKVWAEIMYHFLSAIFG